MIKFTYNLRTEKIIVVFAYDPGAAMRVKELGAYAHYEETPTKTFNGVQNIKKFKHWQMDLTAENVEALERSQGVKDFHIDAVIFAAWETKQEHQKKNLRLSRAIETDFKLQPRWEHLQNKIPSFQMAALEYIRLNARGVMLGDDDYLDPKLEALLAIETGEMHPVLIICPIENKFTWAGKLKRHFPHRKFEILDENKFGVDEFTQVAVIGYHHFMQCHDVLSAVNWKTLILDDNRHINNHAEPRTKKIIEFSESIPRKIILSNGFDLSKPKTMIAALMIAGYIKEVGGFWHYVNKYCQAKQSPHGWDFSGAAHIEELDEKLRALFVIARKKEQIKTQIKDEMSKIIEGEKKENGN